MIRIERAPAVQAPGVDTVTFPPLHAVFTQDYDQDLGIIITVSSLMVMPSRLSHIKHSILSAVGALRVLESRHAKFQGKIIIALDNDVHVPETLHEFIEDLSEDNTILTVSPADTDDDAALGPARTRNAALRAAQLTESCEYITALSGDAALDIFGFCAMFSVLHTHSYLTFALSPRAQLTEPLATMEHIPPRGILSYWTGDSFPFHTDGAIVKSRALDAVEGWDESLTFARIPDIAMLTRINEDYPGLVVNEHTVFCDPRDTSTYSAEYVKHWLDTPVESTGRFARDCELEHHIRTIVKTTDWN